MPDEACQSALGTARGSELSPFLESCVIAFFAAISAREGGGKQRAWAKRATKETEPGMEKWFVLLAPSLCHSRVSVTEGHGTFSGKPPQLLL